MRRGSKLKKREEIKKVKFRIEKDSLGRLKIPDRAFYGIETQRALQNFPISGLKLQPIFITSYLLIKKAAAIANRKLHTLDKGKADAIINACNILLKGKHQDQFRVDVYQAGAGTSQNMNINEVIANTALSLLKRKKGSYNIINPHDHVNLSQSTNDTFHSAMHIAALLEIQDLLLPALSALARSLKKKARQFKKIIKSGRTHLRDALPITLGQEFHAYAETIKKNIHHVKEDSLPLQYINLGGTAIGTRANASKRFQTFVIKELNKSTHLNLRPAPDLIEATSSLGAIARTSASLKILAADLIKISNDIRLLSSGPSTGLNEISLPDVQPGSSIMPGKINPVIPEMLDMVAFQVIGNDSTITLATQAGQLELNVMMPVAVYNLLHSIQILGHALEIFTEKCVKGITAHEKRCREYLERNPILVTYLAPYIGYEKAAQIAKQAYREEKSVKEIILEKKILSKKEIEKIINLRNLTPIKR